MAQEHIFTIDEHHTGINIEKIYKDEYRFPIEMFMSGRKYSGVEATLNKQHGKKILMELILKLLLKGPKQYKSFVNLVLQKFTWLDLKDSLEILLLDGAIQISFKNSKPRRSVDWVPKIVRLDPRAMGFFDEEKLDTNLELTKIKNSVTNLIMDVRSPMKGHVLQWIEEKEITDQSGIVITDCTSFRKFKSIILTVAHYIILKEHEEKLPLRYLSNQIWGQPRLLSTYKNEIALSAGITLSEFDSVLLPDINNTLHTPLILISPIEELQKLVAKLSGLEILEDAFLFLINEMNYCIQRIIGLIGDSENKTLKTFLLDYYALNKEFLKGNSKEAQLSILNNFKNSINGLNKQMLQIKHIRCKFEMIILEEVGSGSFARVYKVFDPESSKIVACKILFPRSYFKQVYGNDGDEYVLRFKREVRLLTKELQHKNIIDVEKIQLEGSPFWFTMPLASFSLDKWMKENHNTSEDQRIEIFNQILLGVKYLHERDKYHRDLAPNNILLYETNHGLEVKIADFGLAKDPQSVSFFTGLSKKGYGQEDFTDPEQRNNLADSTHLSDIYSLGALLYYLLSSKLPKKRFYVPVKYQSVVVKAMDKRDQRYQTVSEFEHDLKDCIKKIKRS